MKASDIPTLIQVPFAGSAVAPYIRTIPVDSQIGITDGAASFETGFPPDTFVPEAAGGIPPAGSDFNGILWRISQWARWQGAGGPLPWNAGFSSAVGGYPLGAIIASATLGQMWINIIDDNTSNPDAAGANWQSFYVGSTGVTPASYVRPQLTLAADGKVTAAANGAYPTRTRLTSGSGNYIVADGIKRIFIRMIAGGGGPGGTVTAGATGGTTSFNSITAIGGSGGGTQGGGLLTGGAGGAGGSGVALTRFPGSAGGRGISVTTTTFGTNFPGGSGGVGPFGGGGTTDFPAAANSGAGGGGSPVSAGSGSPMSAGGGGSGEYVELQINNPVGSYPWTVGAAGANGTGGILNAAGSGQIIIDEMYD